MSRLLIAIATVMPLAACAALEVREGFVPFEQQIMSGSHVFGHYMTLEVTRAAPPLTPGDQAVALSAAGDYCAGQGKVMVMSDEQVSFLRPWDGVWVLYAWCEAASG